MKNRSCHPLHPALALSLLAGLVAVAPASADLTQSYGYVRVLDGAATLFQSDTGTRSDVEVHQPLLTGDRVWVSPGSQLEAVLSDGNRVRIGGDSEVDFLRLAYSPDQSDRFTVLSMLEGDLQLRVVEDALGDELPRIDTANATVYIHEPGSYRISADRRGWTRIVVREGYAEVATQQGSSVLRVNEEALVEGETMAAVHIRGADAEDSLERWAEELDVQAAGADLPYVDEPLRYAAAPLAEHGTWVTIDQRPAWRPYVSVSWRPYWRGRWVYSPSGLTWVSYEPWGWVPYHYGSWTRHPYHGWVWYPGSVYSPAWVYWYWGPSYAAWIPTGYYTHYYGPYYHPYYPGFHFGVHGWAGGSWGLFFNWNFCRTGYIGHHHQHAYSHLGSDLYHRMRHASVERGLITTDTRPLTPDRWRHHDQVVEALTARSARHAASVKGELPDVTPFVARNPELPSKVRLSVLEAKEAVASKRTSAGHGGLRPDLTPLRPTPTVKGVSQPRTVTPTPRNSPGVSGGRYPTAGRAEAVSSALRHAQSATPLAGQSKAQAESDKGRGSTSSRPEGWWRRSPRDGADSGIVVRESQKSITPRSTPSASPQSSPSVAPNRRPTRPSFSGTETYKSNDGPAPSLRPVTRSYDAPRSPKSPTTLGRSPERREPVVRRLVDRMRSASSNRYQSKSAAPAPGQSSSPRTTRSNPPTSRPPATTSRPVPKRPTQSLSRPTTVRPSTSTSRATPRSSGSRSSGSKGVRSSSSRSSPRSSPSKPDRH